MNEYTKKLTEMVGQTEAQRLLRWAHKARKISVKAENNTWTSEEMKWADLWITDHGYYSDRKLEALAMIAVLRDEFKGRITINISDATGHFLTIEDYQTWQCEGMVSIWGRPNDQLVFNG